MTVEVVERVVVMVAHGYVLFVVVMQVLSALPIIFGEPVAALDARSAIEVVFREVAGSGDVATGYPSVLK